MMNNFLTLYGYELKKIMKRRIVLYTLIILAFTVIYQIVWTPLSYTHTWVDKSGNVISMSDLEYLMDQKEKTKVLNGRTVDDALLYEVRDAYKNVYRQEYQISTETGGGSGYRTMTMAEIGGTENRENATWEDAETAIRKQEIYQPIYNYIKRLAGYYDAVHTIDADSLYQVRMDNLLMLHWADLLLKEEETAYWTTREDELTKPFTYGYAEGWDQMLDEFIYLNLMLILGIVICLSNTFSDEYLKRTDQLILCSRYGKGKFFFSKIAAGVTFGLICSVLLFMTSLVSAVCIYGAEGSDVVIQICRPLCSRNLTMGQTVFLLGGIYVIVGIMYSLLAMILSAAVKNGIAVMGMMTGGMLLTMLVQISYQNRFASQVHNLLPTMILNVEQLWDDRLVTVFGLHLTNYQTALILYVVVGVLLIWKGNHIWQKLKN